MYIYIYVHMYICIYIDLDTVNRYILSILVIVEDQVLLDKPDFRLFHGCSETGGSQGSI